MNIKLDVCLNILIRQSKNDVKYLSYDNIKKEVVKSNKELSTNVKTHDILKELIYYNLISAKANAEGLYKLNTFKCAKCGKEFDIFDYQEAFYYENYFGYGSHHDEEVFFFSLCAECHDELIDNLLPKLKTEQVFYKNLPLVAFNDPMAGSILPTKNSKDYYKQQLEFLKNNTIKIDKAKTKMPFDIYLLSTKASVNRDSLQPIFYLDLGNREVYRFSIGEVSINEQKFKSLEQTGKKNIEKVLKYLDKNDYFLIKHFEKKITDIKIMKLLYSSPLAKGGNDDKNPDFEIVKDGKDIVLCRYLGGDNIVNIPDGVTKIFERAFKRSPQITEVYMPNSVCEIGSGAFGGLENLEKVELSENLTVVPQWMFSGCTKLKYILLPNSIKTIGIGAFYSCESLEEIALPLGLEKIERSAFNYCKKLKEIVIPDSIVSYSSFTELFTGCYSLSLVSIPKNCKLRGHSSFRFPNVRCEYRK